MSEYVGRQMSEWKTILQFYSIFQRWKIMVKGRLRLNDSAGPRIDSLNNHF